VLRLSIRLLLNSALIEILPTKGKVITFTEEVVGVPLGFESPLIHALIDLEGKLTMFVRIVNCKAGNLKKEMK